MRFVGLALHDAGPQLELDARIAALDNELATYARRDTAAGAWRPSPASAC
jgi:hypothetical protein